MVGDIVDSETVNDCCDEYDTDKKNNNDDINSKNNN